VGGQTRYEVEPIGVIHSPFMVPNGTPIQPVYGGGFEGSVEVFEPFRDALVDLDGFDRIWLLYWCDRAVGWRPRVVPYRDDVARGLFATRAPGRPNPIGLSCVRLLSVESGVLRIRELDILDGAPLLDIKPYVPDFDSFPAVRSGWLARSDATRRTADDRFHREV